MRKNKELPCWLSMRFVCLRIRETKNSIEKLCDQVETVNRFCYSRGKLNAKGGCEAAVTTKVRIRKRGEL